MVKSIITAVIAGAIVIALTFVALYVNEVFYRRQTIIIILAPPGTGIKMPPPALPGLPQLSQPDRSI